MTVRFRRTPLHREQLPLVVAGGAVGVAARYLLTAELGDPLASVPVIFLINALGSGLLGLLVGWAAQRRRLRAFLGTGVLGGFTSYSALAPALALVTVTTAGAVGDGSLAAAVTLVLLVIGGVMLFVAAPVAIAALGYALGRRLAGEDDA